MTVQLTGLPAVTGAGSASLEIRTGQRLRVDGTKGVVTVLEQSAEEAGPLGGTEETRPETVLEAAS